MADNNWGAAPAATKAEAGAWGTSDLRSALPETNGHNGADHHSVNGEKGAPAPIEQVQPPKLEGWVEATPYHYDEFANRETEWDGQAPIYEWDGEEGDIGPEFPELEVQLFGPVEERGRRGIDFSAIAELELVQEGPTRVEPIDNFRDAGLHPAMLRNVELAGYDVPTPIQRYCIPSISQGHDVIAIAQTGELIFRRPPHNLDTDISSGSGKTAAYLIPIINKLMGKAKKLAAPRPNPATYQPGIDQPCRAEPLVVIVVPSRELAVQIFNEARKFCYRSMLRPCVLYGGGSMRDQLDQLSKGCDVLVASPGRLIDFMDRPEVLSLRRVRYMVIDEADEMLDDDWKDEFDQILSGGGKLTQHNILPLSQTHDELGLILCDLYRPGRGQHQVHALLRHFPQVRSRPRQDSSCGQPCASPRWTCRQHPLKHQAGCHLGGALLEEAGLPGPS